jgi:hypothetical protein
MMTRRDDLVLPAVVGDSITSPEFTIERDFIAYAVAGGEYHFTARQFAMDRLNPGMRQEGWLNDLNGLVYHEGEYHLFAQRWNKCRIHAVSNDLVHWSTRGSAAVPVSRRSFL